jgi:hypothetical protein
MKDNRDCPFLAMFVKIKKESVDKKQISVIVVIEQRQHCFGILSKGGA